MSGAPVGGSLGDMDTDLTTEKSKDVDTVLLTWLADDRLARAVDGLMQAMDNARGELNRLHENAERRAEELAGV